MTIEQDQLSAARSIMERLHPDFGKEIDNVVEQGVSFYVASHKAILSHLNLVPYGHAVTPLDFMTDRSSGEWNVEYFMRLFNRMNGIAFGVRGIPMPFWVMIDLALMPSAAVIAAVSQDRFAEMLQAIRPSGARDKMEELLADTRASAEGCPIPVAGYCAAPSAAPERWMGWSLWSVMPGLGVAPSVKALALAIYRTGHQVGVTQWSNTVLRVHTRFGPLRVLSATLPLHTVPGSFAYEVDLSGSRRHASQDPTALLDAGDLQSIHDMQATMSAGEKEYFVVSPGLIYRSGKPMVPIVEVRLAEAKVRRV